VLVFYSFDFGSAGSYLKKKTLLPMKNDGQVLMKLPATPIYRIFVSLRQAAGYQNGFNSIFLVRFRNHGLKPLAAFAHQYNPN